MQQQDFSAMSAKNNPNPTINDINFNIGLQTTDNGNQSSNLTARELPMVIIYKFTINTYLLLICTLFISLLLDSWC